MQTGDTATFLGVLGVGTVLLLLVLAMLRRRRHQREDADVADLRSEHADREVSPALAALLGSSAPGSRRLTIPPRAAAPGRVPGPGVMSVAGVDLPAGRPERRVDAVMVELAVGDGDPGPGAATEQLWVASRASTDAPRLFRQLAAGFSESGLWPLLLPPAADPPPVDGEWFERDGQRHEVDAQAPGERFRRRLAVSLSGGSPLASTDRLAATGVAQGQLARGSGKRTDALAVAFEEFGFARLALAAGCRPADVLHAIAWPGAAAAEVPSAELADLVASWEERYGALIVAIEETSMLLAILRPPATEDEAIEALAELHALCPDEAADWGDDTSAAARLVNAPTWRLSWH